MPQEEILLADQEIHELLGEGAIKLSTPSQNQCLSSISLVPEKDVGHYQEIKSKHLAHFLCAFRNGEITPSKKAFQERGPHEFLKKNSKIQVVRQSKTISFPVFWVRSSLQGIHETNATSHFSVEETYV